MLTALMSGAVVLGAAVAGLGAIPSAQAAGSGLPARAVYSNLTEVIVRPGQTLWAIAGRAEPGVDPRIVVQQIVALNALPSSTAIQPGERLWIPRG